MKLWRDRSEKLAKQCAMAMANGREDRQRFVGSLGMGKGDGFFLGGTLN